jgi:hypothetical protein
VCVETRFIDFSFSIHPSERSETKNTGEKQNTDSQPTIFANFSEIVDFFFIDTNPFQLKYWTHPKDDHYDWRGVAPRGKYIHNLLKVHILDETNLIHVKQDVLHSERN